MKKMVLSVAASAAVLAACHGRVDQTQAIKIDANTTLLVKVEGVEAYGVGVPAAEPGEPIHRVLQSSDRKVLFAYDLQLTQGSPDGLYRLLLKPSAQKPTFAKTREVTLRPRQDSVRVELMEKPGTGEKVTDVFSLTPRGDEPLSPGAHLIRLHNKVFNWFHGK